LLHRSYNSNRTHFTESFLSGDSRSYVEKVYDAWVKDPSNVDSSWEEYFKNMNISSNLSNAYSSPCSEMSYNATSEYGLKETKGITSLVENYRQHGYEIAKVNPLRAMDKMRLSSEIIQIRLEQ
jgi:2-oxoglutarate dehydrogenase E1 component